MASQTSLGMAPKVRTAFALLLILLFTLALMSCEQKSEVALPAKQSFTPEKELERAQLRKDLKKLEKNIDRELERVGDNLALGNKKDRDNLFYADRKLKSNRSKVEKALRDLENCSEANWEMTKTITLETLKEIKLSSNQLAYRFEDLLIER